MLHAKTTVHKHNENKREYPYIGIGKLSRSIVLWVKPEYGFIIDKGLTENKAVNIGDPVFGPTTENFYDVFEGEITLANHSL